MSQESTTVAEDQKKQEREQRLEAALSSTLSTGEVLPSGARSEGGPAGDGVKAEVSATTVGRMLGLATVADLRILEGKIDLMSTRVNNLTIRMEKVLTLLNAAPTGSDLERVDVQIASLRGYMKEVLQGLPEKDGAGEQPGLKKRLSSSIRATEAEEG